jgi:hypothetical protein
VFPALEAEQIADAAGVKAVAVDGDVNPVFEAGAQVAETMRVRGNSRRSRISRGGIQTSRKVRLRSSSASPRESRA